MEMSNKTYDLLRTISWLAVPTAVLLTGLIDLATTDNITTWALISGALSLFQTFLGSTLYNSNKIYNAKQGLESDNDIE